MTAPDPIAKSLRNGLDKIDVAERIGTSICSEVKIKLSTQ
jgi:hypothetical protein